MKYLKILLVCLLVSGALALAVRAAVRPEPRELTLIARGMAFYLPGDPTPNPRLIARRGEELRITLRNEDRGMAHDLAVASRSGERKSTPVLREAGETAELTLRAPGEPGEYDYLCTRHARMMRGVLEVR
ncbi:MAG: plastocyanin/azurin family copper-binding protein [Thermoanaerobaculia bacterium]